MKTNDLGLSIYQQRLLTCAEIVRKGTEKFDLSVWQCGTARCAVGDYCLSEVSEMKLVESQPILPNGAYGWDAVREHFGLNFYEAEYLFISSSYSKKPTRREVADRIEHFALYEHADA